MKNIKLKLGYKTCLLGLLSVALVSCERELSDEAVFAKFANAPEIFSDSPVGLGSDFYFPFAGSKPTAWTVDENEGYNSDASMRFDVPNANDPEGNYAGAIFRIDGAGRDLTGYNALTFWAKASQGVVIGELGFGQDFLGNKYQVNASSVSLGTNWSKYVIPIPDPSKLIEERGMFWYSAGTQETGGNGYTFWIDELKFENEGSVSQPRPIIFSGEDSVLQTFSGSEINLAASGLQAKFNVADGRDVTVNTAPAYFNFISSNTDVAIVDEKGVTTIIGEGVAEVTASLAGIKAVGSITITSSGALALAPVPTRPAADVKSIFSDAYTPATISNFNPGFGGSTTQTTELGATGQKVLLYSNNNFTGIIFDSTIDASTLTHMHVDIYAENPGTNVNIQIRDVGANGEIETNIFTGFPDGDDKDKRYNATGLTVGAWTSIDIPLDGDLAAQKNNLGAIILAGGPDFILDNIYFY
ncbi:glycosyl hydrolase family 16 [Aestuariivivens sediminis]|uniref:glycosyl hydrolase family 16 n=1 Tax=Aestuariivivens sediminis TaxID=2913557 RepID=UPI001F574569|nr:glycosyl hydrolase family 16 [Aestuariivivens sediminis]